MPGRKLVAAGTSWHFRAFPRRDPPRTFFFLQSTDATQTFRRNRCHRRSGHELSPYTRGIIYGKSLGDLSTRRIGHDLQILPATVHYTLKQSILRNHGKLVPRSGRPMALSAADQRFLLILVKRNPFIRY